VVAGVAEAAGVDRASKKARLPSSPQDTMSVVSLSIVCDTITFDELWCILAGSCQASSSLVFAGLMENSSISTDRGHTTA
jgi:hypothetical protein